MMEYFINLNLIKIKIYIILYFIILFKNFIKYILF